jgi:hypothetical protein
MKMTLDSISWPLINSTFEKREAAIEISTNGKRDVTRDDESTTTKNKETSVTTPVSSDKDQTHTTDKSRSATTTEKEDHPTTTTRSGTIYIK